MRDALTDEQLELENLRAEVRQLQGVVARLVNASGLRDLETGDGQIIFGEGQISIHPLQGMMLVFDDDAAITDFIQWLYVTSQAELVDPGVTVIGPKYMKANAYLQKFRWEGEGGIVPASWFFEYGLDASDLVTFNFNDKFKWNGATATFESAGAIRPVTSASDPADNVEGAIYFNTISNTWEGYDGASWVTIGPSTGGSGIGQEVAWMSSIFGGPFP